MCACVALQTCLRRRGREQSYYVSDSRVVVFMKRKGDGGQPKRLKYKTSIESW